MRDGARHDGTEPAILAESALPAPLPPSSPGQRPPVVSVEARGDSLRIETPRGWRDPAAVRRDLAPVRAAILRATLRIVVTRGRVSVPDVDTIAPDLARALAPALPPVDVWPSGWRELFEERASIAAESGATDAEALATAEAELRVAVWRGDVEAVEAVEACA